MACPVCKRVLCDHTPEERGQSQDEMLADMYFGTYEGCVFTDDQREDRARKAFNQFGKSATSVVIDLLGYGKAQELINKA